MDDILQKALDRVAKLATTIDAAEAGVHTALLLYGDGQTSGREAATYMLAKRRELLGGHGEKDDTTAAG